MNQAEAKQFNEPYQRHLRLLKLQGKSQKTIDAYSRAVRRVSEHFDCCPDQLTPEQLEIYFARLVESPLMEHSQNRSKWPAILLAVCA